MSTIAQRVKNRTQLLLISLAFLGLACSSKGTIHGKVTLGGTQPVTSGIVIFTGADDVPFSGYINQQGVYEIKKVTPGEKRVTLVNAMVGHATEKITDPTARPSAPAVLLIPKKYANPDNGLKYTVKSGSQTIDIDLAQ